MNYLLHRQGYPNSVVNIPEGLDNLMGDISREVLRYQPNPEGMYDFIANYLESLMRTRETMQTTEEIIQQIIGRVADVANELVTLGIESKRATSAVNIIQSNFKQYIDSERKKQFANIESEFRQTEVLDELVRSCNFTEWEIMKTKSTIADAYQKFIAEYLTAIENTIFKKSEIRSIAEHKFERYFDDTYKNAIFNKAATIIQNAFKTYQFRNNFSFVKKTLEEIHEKEDTAYLPLFGPKEMTYYNRAAVAIQNYFNTDEVEASRRAAQVIQRFYRKHKKIRKQATETDSMKTKSYESTKTKQNLLNVLKYKEPADTTHNTKSSAATNIPKFFRRHRDAAKRFHNDVGLLRAAITIQRRYKAMQREKRDAAITIQRAYRITRQRKEKAAIRIQRAYRKMALRRVNAAINLQRIYRRQKREMERNSRK